MSRPTYMTIDLVSLKHNLLRVRELARDRSVIAMVKANAYGHGLIRVAHALSDADAFGVASLDEGIQLREAGITQPIVLIEGLFNPGELVEAINRNFTLVVHHLPHIEMLESLQIGTPLYDHLIAHPLSIWLKINTGMHRLGFDAEDVHPIYQRLFALPWIKKPLGFMTHFAKADDITSDATNQQLALFNSITKDLVGFRSLANSAGILAWEKAHGDSIRPGLMLYGASPFSHKTGSDHQLQPVMTLHSKLIAIHQIKKGAKVGYGGTWMAPRNTTIGVVGVGYGDGYPQFAENGTPVLIRGVECPLVGRVSMDMLTVDLGNLPHAELGDSVILWGAGLAVERVAKHCRTSAYEVLTRMTPRPKIEIRECNRNNE